MRTGRIVSSIVGLLSLSLSARAAPVTWEFSGEVTAVLDVFDRFDGSVTVGTPFSGSFTFESTTPDSEPDDPTNGFYEGAITTLSGMVGEFPFASVGLLDIRILNDFLPYPYDSFGFQGNALLVNRVVETSFGLLFDGPNIFSTDGLPLVPPPLEGLFGTAFGFNSQEEGIFIAGEINHLVPEPGTLCLLGLCTILFTRRSRPSLRRSKGRNSPILPLSVLCVLTGVIPVLPRAEAQEVCGCMDMVFLIDVTGSFTANDRLAIRQQLRSLVENTAIPTSSGDLRLGFITFGDDVKVKRTLTTDVNAVLGTLDNVLQEPAEEGGGESSLPEPSDQAIREMLGGCSRCPAANVRFESVPFRGECIKHAMSSERIES